LSLYTNFDHYDVPIGPDGTPYEFYEALRDEAIQTETPIGWSEVYGGFWVVTGYPEAQEIQRNSEAFSNQAVNFPRFSTPGDRQLMLAGHDAPEHMKYRRFVQSQFSPARATAFGAQLREVSNELIDRFIESGRVDIAEVYTGEVPARLAAIMGNLPAKDADLYRAWVHAVTQVKRNDPALSEAQFKELDDYFFERVADWRTREGDDYITMVGQQELDGARISDAEFRDLFLGLIMGAIDNTFYLLSNMWWRLSWDKELRRQLVRRPDMIPLAIDEFLRFYSPALNGRLIKERITVGGVTMEPGQTVILLHALENRDPREFEYPDEFIPERSPNRHFALGLGIHRCLGMHILRIEAQVALEEFLKRIPEWELDPERKPKWYAGQVSGFEAVPIVFPPGGGSRDASWSPGRALATA
jgi:cytochrome P450